MEIRKAAVTISPRLELGNPSGILFWHCVTYFYELRNVGEFELYPEFADNGRLHYHGIVHIKDEIKWYKKALPTLNRLGYVVVKNNINEGWEEYIKKNWSVTKQVLDIEAPINREYVIEQYTNFKKKQNIVKNFVAHLDGTPQKKQVVNLIDRLSQTDNSSTQKVST